MGGTVGGTVGHLVPGDPALHSGAALIGRLGGKRIRRAPSLGREHLDQLLHLLAALRAGKIDLRAGG